MDDESIIPARNVTPMLRADATDDNLDEEKPAPKFAKGGPVKHHHKDETVPGEDVGDDGRVDGRFVLACPICSLEACGHNLAKIERFIPDTEAGK